MVEDLGFACGLWSPVSGDRWLCRRSHRGVRESKMGIEGVTIPFIFGACYSSRVMYRHSNIHDERTIFLGEIRILALMPNLRQDEKEN